MPDAPDEIELKTSELYHRHKRNLLFACSLAIIIIASRPAIGVSVPTMGDGKIPIVIAFTIIPLSILYFAAQYFIEFRIVIARNSAWAANKTDEKLTAAFSHHIKMIKAISESIDKKEEEISNSITALNNMLKILAKYHSTKIGISSEELSSAIHATLNLPEFRSSAFTTREMSSAIARDIYTKNENDFGISFPKIEKEIAKSNQSLESILLKLAELNGLILSNTKSNAELNRNFRKIHNSIYLEQRLGRTVLDGFVPAILTVISIGLCAASLFGLIPPSQQRTTEKPSQSMRQ